MLQCVTKTLTEERSWKCNFESPPITEPLIPKQSNDLLSNLPLFSTCSFSVWLLCAPKKRQTIGSRHLLLFAPNVLKFRRLCFQNKMALEPYIKSAEIEPQLCQVIANNEDVTTKATKCATFSRGVGWRHLLIGFLLICFGISNSWQYKNGKFCTFISNKRRRFCQRNWRAFNGSSINSTSSEGLGFEFKPQG